MNITAEDAVTQVLKLSKHIRIVTICDKEGNKIFSARRKTTENLLTPNESTQSLTISAQNMKGRKKLARKLGVCRYTLAEYTKVKRMVMPADKKHLLYITCSPEFDHRKIVRLVDSLRTSQ